MKIIYVTGHSCSPNAVVPDRLWSVDPTNKTFTHIGVVDSIDQMAITLVEHLGATVTIMRIPDDAFKNFLISLGFIQK